MITERHVPTEQLPEGTPLGRFVVDAWIRDGSSATVYRGRHIETGAAVAIKVMTRGAAQDATARARFARETVLLGRLAGAPHIAMVHDVGDLPDGRRFLVTEWVEGEDLEDVLRRLRDQGRRMSPLRAFRIARDIAAALLFAHMRGVVHRDIKPANIMLDPSGPVEIAKLLDFGVSADLAQQRSRQNLTQGLAIGSEIYMSPEQSLGQSPAPAMDVWALGALMLEMLRGQPPGLELRHGVFPPFPEPAPFPADAIPLVTACVSMDPRFRPDARQLQERLERLIAELEHDVPEPRTFGATVRAPAGIPAAQVVAQAAAQQAAAQQAAPYQGLASSPSLAAPRPQVTQTTPRGMTTSGAFDCSSAGAEEGPSAAQLESPHPPRRWEFPVPPPPPGLAPPIPMPLPGNHMPAPMARIEPTVGPWAPVAPVWSGMTAPAPLPPPVPEPVGPRARAGGAPARWLSLGLGFSGLSLGLVGAFFWAQSSLMETEPHGPRTAAAVVEPPAAAKPENLEAPEPEPKPEPEVPPAAEPAAPKPAAAAPPAMPASPPVVAAAAKPAPAGEEEAPASSPSKAKPTKPAAERDQAPRDPKTAPRNDAVAKEPRPPKSEGPTPQECEADRQAAEAARRERDWNEVLSATTRRRCWPSSVDRQLLRVTALLELGRYEACVKEAGSSSEKSIQVRVAVCRDRMGAG